MRFQAIVMIAGLIWTNPAAAQTEPLSTANAFFKALLDGDVAATRNLRTAEAVLGAGDVAGPMAQSEEVLMVFSQRKCSIGELALLSEAVDRLLLNELSVTSGDARWVKGTMSCQTDKGGIKDSPVRVVVTGGKIAALSF